MNELELWEIAGNLKERVEPPVGCPSIPQDQRTTKQTTPLWPFLDLELIGNSGIWR